MKLIISYIEEVSDNYDDVVCPNRSMNHANL